MMGTREKTKPESFSIHVSFRRGMYKRVTNTVCSNHDYPDLHRATSFQKVISSPSPVPTLCRLLGRTRYHARAITAPHTALSQHRASPEMTSQQAQLPNASPQVKFPDVEQSISFQTSSQTSSQTSLVAHVSASSRDRSSTQEEQCSQPTSTSHTIRAARQSCSASVQCQHSNNPTAFKQLS